MFVEFRIMPLGSFSHFSEAIIAVLELVEASGLTYQLTPAGIGIEGASQEVIPLIQQCHHCLRQKPVMTIAMFENDENDEEESQSTQTIPNLAAVKERLERTLRRVDA